MSIEANTRAASAAKRISQLSLAVLVTRIGGGGAAFLLNILLAHILGLRGIGLYFLATTVAAFAIVLGRAGQENVVLRFGAVATERREWHKIGAIRRGSRRLVFFASVVVSCVLLLVARPLAVVAFHEPALSHLFRIVAISVPVSALATVDVEIVRASGRVRLAALLEALPSPILSLLVLVPLGIAFGVTGAVLGTVVAAVLVLSVVSFTARRQVRGFDSREGYFDRSLLIRTGIPLLWVVLSGMILSTTDTIMLGILADARQVGFYGVSARAAGLASTALAAVTAVVAPRFAALHAAGRQDELSGLARTATGRAVLFALPVLTVCLAAPAAVLSLFGSDFTAATSTLMVLAVGHAVNVVTGPVGYLLMMSGRERVLRNNVLAAGVLNIGLNVLLIPAMGATGAATATAASMILVNVLSLIQVWRHLGIWILAPSTSNRHE